MNQRSSEQESGQLRCGGLGGCRLRETQKNDLNDGALALGTLPLSGCYAAPGQRTACCLSFLRVCDLPILMPSVPARLQHLGDENVAKGQNKTNKSEAGLTESERSLKNERKYVHTNEGIQETLVGSSDGASN